MRARSVSLGMGLCAAALFLTGCLSTTPRLVKIGFVAPFEGRYREIGVDVIPAARLAIREWAAQHGHDPIAIELVAYDDAGDPAQAAAQARKIAADPAVSVVVGHWLEETTAAALPVYADADLTLIGYTLADLPAHGEHYNLSPSLAQIQSAAAQWAEGQPAAVEMAVTATDLIAALQDFETTSGRLSIGGPVWGLSQFYSVSEGRADGSYFVTGAALPDDRSGEFWTADRRERFVTDFKAGSLGAPPGLLSVSAYEATWLALDLIAADYALVNEDSPAGGFRFEGRRLDPPALHVYQWVNGNRRLVETVP